MSRAGVAFRRWRTKHIRPSGGTPAKRRTWSVFAIILVAAIVLAVLFQSGLRPIVEQMALSRVRYLAGLVINDAVNDQVASDGAGYEYFIELEKDSTGRITALKTDMVAINRFKAEVTSRVLNEINNLDTSEVNIPLGNIIGGELFSGRGPKIPVNVVPIGSAQTEFSSVLKTAGINQTRHQIVVTVTADIAILLLGFSVGASVSTQVIVAETIIVGEVPGNYTYLEDTNRSSYELYSALEP